MEFKTTHPKSVKEWRSWLQKNHKKESKVGLIVYKKHTGKPTITHSESMKEAICFGWIDTTIKKLDEDRYIRHFAKRSKNSRWSNATQGYARNLIKEGKMSPEGLLRYKEGLKKPTIDLILPENHFPEDLKEALEKNPSAKANFENFAPSYKRTFIRWLEHAKLPETRVKRIKAIIAKAESNNKRFL